MKLYTYWRSSAAYRIRIALNLKGIAYDDHYINMLRDGGEQLKEEYARINAQKLVPALETDQNEILTQSMAIIEYLDESYPETPALLPESTLARARVRALAQAIACEIHPLNNLRVLKYLVNEMGVSEEQKMSWYHHWIVEGFSALETMLADSDTTGQFCYGNTPGLADACLIPQLYNAHRFKVNMSAFPTINRIEKACLELKAFQDARPELQGDAT
ncbi:maleylacetoacetate isomerase [Motiliproteus sp. MSK22-1]|uniref:maleylacetoacetate isomerase n=1 Tax=Motiliproteus sp. MSK22-1 TaxID=1897630 RepID=UPI0009774CA7|nr:maleylacetoacetate isomerase [Motiliproteus sp. MSK22-1]OMH33589.1 maleylacetoacetate isomerase [Motiliproteus sp. MSK22-1]